MKRCCGVDDWGEEINPDVDFPFSHISHFSNIPNFPFYRFSNFPFFPRTISIMAKVDYLLHESSVGYALFEVVHQADVVGNRLRAVRDAMIDLSRFGKMVKLVSFAPFQYVRRQS